MELLLKLYEEKDLDYAFLPVICYMSEYNLCLL